MTTKVLSSVIFVSCISGITCKYAEYKKGPKLVRMLMNSNSTHLKLNIYCCVIDVKDENFK